MGPKKAITVILLLFVVASVGFLAVKGIHSNDDTQRTENAVETELSSPETPTTAQTLITDPETDVDVVYYCMTSQRCMSCMKIEAFTKEAVEKNFSEKLADKDLVWKMVEVDEPQNRHFIQDYQLYTKSVVLVRYRDGKQVEWKNLDKVWNLLGDKVAFQDYITDEVKAFIETEG